MSTDWLSEYESNEKVIRHVFITDDGLRLYVRPPDRYEKPPSIPNITGYRKMDDSNINEYFSSILHQRYRITDINGHKIGFNYEPLRCDYCMVSTGLWMRRCQQCEKNMCSLCYDERSEEMAHIHHAKNWHRRKNDLFICFNHEKEGYFTHNEIDSINIIVNCDLCGINSNQQIGSWYCNRRLDKDLCLGCLNSVPMRKKVREILGNGEGWKFIDFSHPPMYGMGSVLDWIPLLQNNNRKEILLVNLNRKSDLFMKTALMIIDDNGFSKYYTFPYSVEHVLEKVKDKGDLQFMKS